MLVTVTSPLSRIENAEAPETPAFTNEQTPSASSSTESQVGATLELEILLAKLLVLLPQTAEVTDALHD